MRKSLFYSFILLLAVCTVKMGMADTTPMHVTPVIHHAPTPTSSNVQQPYIQILQATYGAGESVANVTEKLQAHIPPNFSNFTLSSANVTPDQYGSWPNTLFGDPAFGKGKTLNVIYAGVSGQRLTASAGEHDSLVLQLDANSIKMIQAKEAADKAAEDAAEAAKAEAAKETAAKAEEAKAEAAKEAATREALATKEEAALQVELQNEGFKLEPGTFNKISVGRKDKLEAWAIDVNGDLYRYDTKSKNTNPWVKQDIKSPVCPIKIIKAIYGTSDQTKDVSAVLQTQIPSTASTLVLSSQTVGVDQYGSWQNKIFGDPASGKGKMLTVTYQRSDGVIRTVSVQERAPLEFLTNPNPAVKLIDIAVSSDGDVVAIRDNNTALKYDWAKNAWNILPASNQDTVKLENITIADGITYVLSQDSVIYKYDVQKSGASWEKVGNGTDVISIAAGVSTDKKVILIKIDKNGKAYELVASKWLELTEATDLKDITVGSEKYIFAVDKKGSLWKLRYKTKKWVSVKTKEGKQVSGFSSISVNNNGMFFALDVSGQNWHRHLNHKKLDKTTKKEAAAKTEKVKTKTEKKISKAEKKVAKTVKKSEKKAAQKTVKKLPNQKAKKEGTKSLTVEQKSTEKEEA